MGVGLGPGVTVGVCIGAGAGNAWQADRARMTHNQINLFVEFMQTL